MITWRNRVKITVLTAAAAVGTWIVYDANRQRLKVVDEAELAEAIMERYAAVTYSTNVASVVGWTSTRWATNGTKDIWGGYSNVVIFIPAAANSGYGHHLNGTYHFARRASTRLEMQDVGHYNYGGWSADRGWMDIYTNGLNVLMDLGATGGGRKGRRVGGWALSSRNTDYLDMALPRGFGLASAWFLSAYFTPELLAFGYDPADCAATPGGVDTNRVTYWHPGSWHTATNEAAQRPLRQDRWYTGTGAYAGWVIENYQNPLVIWPSVSPFTEGYLADQIAALLPSTPFSYAPLRHYVDFTLATEGMTDFDGWTNSAGLPSIAANANFQTNRAMWYAGSQAILTREAVTGLGLALMDLQPIVVEAYWTNATSAIYYSNWFTNSAAGWDQMLVNPGWHTEPNVFPADDQPYPCPAYELRLDMKGSEFYLIWTFTQASPAARLGTGHNAHVWEEATAHYWSNGGDIPAGEAVVQVVTNRLVTLARESGMAGPDHVFDVVVPSFIDPPPTSFYPTYTEFTNGWSQNGYMIERPIVVAAPTWDVPRGN